MGNIFKGRVIIFTVIALVATVYYFILRPFINIKEKFETENSDAFGDKIKEMRQLLDDMEKMMTPKEEKKVESKEDVDDPKEDVDDPKEESSDEEIKRSSDEEELASKLEVGEEPLAEVESFANYEPYINSFMGV